MSHGKLFPGKFMASALALALGAMLAPALLAQVPQPGYPTATQAYPAATAPTFAPTAMPPQAHPIRDLFAGTIATVLQTASGGLVGALNGRLLDWFARKGQAQPATYQAGGYPASTTVTAAAQYPATAYPSASAYPAAQASAYPTTAYPTTAYPTTAYPTTAYPTTADPTTAYPTTAYPPSSAYPAATAPSYPASASTYTGNAYPGPSTDASVATQGYPAPSQASGYPTPTSNYPAAAQVYDSRTGQVATGGANPYATPSGGYDGTLYAGIAYEVHALTPDGRSTAINAATYEFRTGDKFMVYYRPSLPGHMEIYNVNPAGRQTLIDATNMAAGQLTALGPYQFTNLTGDESLRLVLSPCSSPQLLAATRDIVRADAMPQSSSAVQLGSCGAPTARGLDVHTRDIEKVAVDGTTSYALDPVSQQERASGQLTPREATIVFHHR
jgi:hypothetical protein